MELPSGGRALRPASFVIVKLLTERAHKGVKDKLQALLVLAERGAEGYASMRHQVEIWLERLSALLDRLDA